MIVVLVMALLVLGAAWLGLVDLASDCWERARVLVEEQRERRELLQRNMRELIAELAYADHEVQEWPLREALSATLVEYRACP